MPRSKKSQSKHDSTVRKLAKQYKDKGYDVDADVSKLNRPDTIRGVRPDLRVRKSGHETAIEVETPDSKDTKRDQKQQKAFKDWSKGSQKKHYRRVVTED